MIFCKDDKNVKPDKDDKDDNDVDNDNDDNDDEYNVLMNILWNLIMTKQINQMKWMITNLTFENLVCPLDKGRTGVWIDG